MAHNVLSITMRLKDVLWILIEWNTLITALDNKHCRLSNHKESKASVYSAFYIGNCTVEQPCLNTRGIQRSGRYDHWIKNSSVLWNLLYYGRHGWVIRLTPEICKCWSHVSLGDQSMTHTCMPFLSQLIPDISEEAGKKCDYNLGRLWITAKCGRNLSTILCAALSRPTGGQVRATLWVGTLFQ